MELARQVIHYGDEISHPLAKSRAQLDQFPSGLRQATEQMLWRAKAQRTILETGRSKNRPGPKAARSML
jgi:hypothetical protein